MTNDLVTPVKIRINPFIRTKISKGYCSIYAEGNSQLIILENAEGEELMTTYATKRTYVKYAEPVFARSHYGMLNLEVRDVSHNILVDSSTGYEDIKDILDEAASDVHEDVNFAAYYILSKG